MQGGNFTMLFSMPLGKGSQDYNVRIPDFPLFMLTHNKFYKPLLLELHRLAKLLKIAEVNAISQNIFRIMIGFYELRIGEFHC